MLSILLVDDHKHLVESMATTIDWRQHGVQHVYQAYSGHEALERIAGHDIHVVVTDIRMPVMSGLELVEQVRERWPHIDCILLTGFAEFQYAKRAIELQAVSYLIKPVRDEELLNVVRTLADKRSQRLLKEAELERAKETLDRQLPQLKADLFEARTSTEQSVAAERERIAYDIHDIFGHTLTATLVQLEAAKRLWAIDGRRGLERLEQSQELVRKGLQDIRETVWTIRQPEAQGNLESELLQLIGEAERTADITIKASIELPEAVLDQRLRQVLYRALQEGITNGVRHGRGGYFQFRLQVKEDELRFSLWNDGKPYDGRAHGFGLTAMQERLKPLGGVLTLSASSAPSGTLLHIRVPLARLGQRQEGRKDEG
ncbi:Histidine kinase [Paenibacillus sp. UNCCL117]|uniref:response regulator n=1 Tax=unclassified Paenibacillus TaxID=185978 RepID=UPI000890BF4E|nr:MULTISPECIES: response regulator [unclassified Paenibacillus]SDC40987.1 Histidine kinase [Paenibacillus sp. cl123]SFW13645.1 Histidine kinase [Paenibacillus sp. UNCCL117]